jgi:hypothetical protein
MYNSTYKIFSTVYKAPYFPLEGRSCGQWNNLFCYLYTKKKNKLHGLSPRANYTDRATAACYLYTEVVKKTPWSECASELYRPIANFCG